MPPCARKADIITHLGAAAAYAIMPEEGGGYEMQYERF